MQPTHIKAGHTTISLSHVSGFNFYPKEKIEFGPKESALNKS